MTTTNTAAATIIRTAAARWSKAHLTLFGALVASSTGCWAPIQIGSPTDNQMIAVDAAIEAIVESGIDEDEVYDLTADAISAEQLLGIADKLDPPAVPVEPKVTEQTHASPVELIAQLRQAGMTVRQIAAAVGVHTSTVYRWSHGSFRPQPQRLATLAALAV